MAGATTPAMSAGASDAFMVSAGLDVLSGVFGYLSGLNDQAIANSRADMIRNRSRANASLYAQKSAAEIAQQKVSYLASGVTLAGSPIDVLDTATRLAQNNIQSILMQGDTEALDEEQQGQNALTQGRNALLGGVSGAAGALSKPAMLGLFTSTGMGTSAAYAAKLDIASGGQGAAANGGVGMGA